MNVAVIKAVKAIAKKTPYKDAEGYKADKGDSNPIPAIPH